MPGLKDLKGDGPACGPLLFFAPVRAVHRAQLAI